MAMPIGHHEPNWMSYVARISHASDLRRRVRNLVELAGTDADAAEKAWVKLEFYLRDFSLHMMGKLRNHTSPSKLRQIGDIMEWVDRPQELSDDPLIWALLGAMEATTTLLGGLHAARAIYRIDTLRAANSLAVQLDASQKRAMETYEDLRSEVALWCEDAEPRSIVVTIRETSHGPLLMAHYGPRSSTEVQW